MLQLVVPCDFTFARFRCSVLIHVFFAVHLYHVTSSDKYVYENVRYKCHLFALSIAGHEKNSRLVARINFSLRHVRKYYTRFMILQFDPIKLY